MELLEYYYSNCLGYYPDDETLISNSAKVLDYLKDCEITEKNIIKFLDSSTEEQLTFDSLPEWLWNKSFLEKGIFYYHNELQILSKAPVWNVFTNKKTITPLSVEMKIIYTHENLINYFNSQFNIILNLSDNKKNKGAIDYLMKRYEVIDFIEPIDYILYLIDYVKCKTEESFDRINNILDISNYENDIYKYLKSMVDNAEFHKKNIIIWR